MGKRGPKPTQAARSKVFSIRLRPDLRAALEGAATANGHSTAEEITNRLRRSFIDDDRIDSAFGSRANYVLMRMIAISLLAGGEFGGDEPDANWLTDPAAFDAAVTMVNIVLEAMRPNGQPSSKVPKRTRRSVFRSMAAMLIDGVQKADPAVALERAGGVEGFELFQAIDAGRAAQFKRDLGEAIMRPHVVREGDRIRIGSKGRKPK